MVITLKESQLMIKSKAFALDVIRVCKELRAENAKVRLLFNFCVREQVSVLISEKPFMPTEKPILSLNCKSHERKIQKVSIG